MKRIKHGSRLLAILLAFIMALGIMPASALGAGAGDTIKVYIDLEGYNLGQEYYIEPTSLELPAGSTAADATGELLALTGHTGAGLPSYLSGVDFDAGDIDIRDIPPYLTEQDIFEDLFDGGGYSKTGWLGAGDYTPFSGWMFTVNHAIADAGVGDYVLSDGDVVRWEFTLWGFGLDLGREGWDEDWGFGSQPYYNHADKTLLLRALFIDGADEGAKQAALDVIIDPLATEAQVSGALAALLGGVEPGEPVDIDITYQMDDSGFVIAKRAFTVAPNLSEAYGYNDAYDGTEATALDAIVAAHIAVFGDDPDDIHAVLELTVGGFISNFMGDGAGNYVYIINGVLPELPPGETVIQDGDNLQLFSIQETFMYADTYAWFEHDGAKVEMLTAAAGEKFDLTVMGTWFVIYGDWGAYDDVVDGAAIVPVEVEDGAGFFGEPLAITDEGGAATLSFEEPGDYILSAIDWDSDMEFPLMSPWLVVTVTDASAADKTALGEAISEAEALKDFYSGNPYINFTTGIWLELQTALTAAKEVMADAGVMQAQVDAAKNALAAAIEVIKNSPEIPAAIEVNGAALELKAGMVTTYDVLYKKDSPVTIKVMASIDSNIFINSASGTSAVEVIYEAGSVPATVRVMVQRGTQAAYQYYLHLKEEEPVKHEDAEWDSFRGNGDNMAVVSAKTARTTDEAFETWVKKFGTGFSTPSVPVILGDSLIFSCGANIYKVNKNTGEQIASRAMSSSPSYGISSITYGEGMVFANIGGGKIQAFDAYTLDSLWVSDTVSGGQSLSPIVYHQGYVYTGFWTGEAAVNSYVCVSVSGENAGKIKWHKDIAGGFYWAGGVIRGDYIIFGSDDGAAGYAGTSRLYALNRLTGSESDVLEVIGDQRSSISYDAATDRLYFTTKAGYIYGVKFDTAAGKFGSYNYTQPVSGYQATSTPVVYKGMAFFGIGSGANGWLIAVDAVTLETIASVDLKAYPQSSPLLSTAYEEKTGKLYLYTTYNNNPGGIIVAEYDTAEKTLTAKEFYTPAPANRNYCIDSVVCDLEGTLYYHNDSGNLFAIGCEPAAEEPDPLAYITALNGALSWIRSHTTNPTVGSVGGEWAVMALARAGVEDDVWYGKYLAALDTEFADGREITRWTDYERVTLALTALGIDASNYSGHDLTAVFKAYIAAAGRPVHSRTINADIFALIALNSRPYGGEADKYADAILAAEKPGGGWGLALTADIDVTAMAVQSLAPYYDSDAAVKAAVDRALEWLETQSASDAEGSAQIIVALSALGRADAKAYVDALLTYYDAETGGFKRGGAVNAMTTEQAAYALVAYDRFLNGKNALYDMRDAGDKTVTLLVNKSALDSEIARAEALRASDYTTPTWDALQTALAAARLVFENEEATQSQVDAAKDVLTAALTALVKVSVGTRAWTAYISVLDNNAKAGQTRVYFAGQYLEIESGDTVYDLLVKTGLELRASGHPSYGLYVEEINGWGEFDDGPQSGWMYKVNGVFPQYSCSMYTLKDGDRVEWVYTRDLGMDVEGYFPDGYKPDTGTDIGPDDENENDELEITVPVEEIPLGAPENWISPFVDVKEGDWFYEAVAFAYSHGLMSGVGEGKFDPNAKLTRAMLVTILYNYDGRPETGGGMIFTDVKDGQWYTGAVAWAYENGIVSGYGNGMFGPNDDITREQLVVILYNYAKRKKFDTSKSDELANYTDLGEAADWAKEALAWAAAEGLVTGRTLTTLAPKGTAIRAEAAVLMMKFIENIAKK